MCFPSIESSTDTLVPSQQFTCDTGQSTAQNCIFHNNANSKEDDEIASQKPIYCRNSKKMYVY